MYMGASLDSCDHRHAYVGYVFQNLKTLVVNLAPNAWIGDVAKRGPINISNKLSAGARQDYYLVPSILPDPVEGIHNFSMGLCREGERPSVVSAVRFGCSPILALYARVAEWPAH